jgi:hypothetical protein
MALFYVLSILLIAKHSDNPFGCWYLHTQELLSYGCIEFVHETSAENREIWVIDVNHIKSVTPSFKGKTECIDRVCARIKLHTRLDIVNTKISATRIKSYYKP